MTVGGLNKPEGMIHSLETRRERVAILSPVCKFSSARDSNRSSVVSLLSTEVQDSTQRCGGKACVVSMYHNAGRVAKAKEGHHNAGLRGKAFDYISGAETQKSSSE